MPLAYTHSPRPVGGPVSFKLDGGRLTIDSGRRVDEVGLDAVDQVRMTYEPRGFSRAAFQTRLRIRGGRSFKLPAGKDAVSLPRTVTISSLNWKSLIEAERLDAEYRTFVRELLKAVAAANPKAEFLAGRSRFVWIGSAVLAVITFAALVFFVTRALQAGAHAAALLGAGLALLGIWQLEPMIRLNRPRAFRSDEPPSGLMP